MTGRSYASHPDFDKVVRAYRDRYGIDLSHMRMKWSKHPVYIDGRRSYDFPDDEHGGSWCTDGAIRINPKMGPVLKRFGIEGMTQAEFRRRLIAHELAHEVWHNQARKEKVKRLIRDSLAKAREENFTTPYLDTYSPDTPRKKFDSELFAEWMSHQLNKKASIQKLAKMPGMTKFKNIRQAVNKIISARKAAKGEPIPSETVGSIVDTTLGSHVLRMKPTGMAETMHGPKFAPDLVAASARSSGFPKRPVYRAEVMPDVSSAVGATASSHAINEGANLRHITPNPALPYDFGDTPILMYNGRKVPGLFSGSLSFYNNNGAEFITHGFQVPENIFSSWTRRYHGTPAEFRQKRHAAGRARRQVLDVTKGNYGERARSNPLGRMNDESLIDANKVAPSRVIVHDPAGNAIDITNLYAYATAQKRVLPNNFNLGRLLAGDMSVLDGLTNAERKAAERYRAIYDIITHFTGASTGKGFVTHDTSTGERLVDRVISQLNKKAGYEYEDIDDESVARHKKGYRNVGRIRLLKTTRGVFVVKDGKLAGFVNTEKKDDGKTWVQALEVAPGFRRRGIARELLRKAVDDMGATYLTVRKTNDAARRLYDSEGWVPYKDEGIMEFRKKAQAYEPPWTIDRIRKNLGDEVADRLAKDPVHRWRSDTGIELVHKEPTKRELRRIIANWRLMSESRRGFQTRSPGSCSE